MGCGSAQGSPSGSRWEKKITFLQAHEIPLGALSVTLSRFGPIGEFLDWKATGDPTGGMNQDRSWTPKELHPPTTSQEPPALLHHRKTPPAEAKPVLSPFPSPSSSPGTNPAPAALKNFRKPPKYKPARRQTPLPKPNPTARDPPLPCRHEGDGLPGSQRKPENPGGHLAPTPRSPTRPSSSGPVHGTWHSILRPSASLSSPTAKSGWLVSGRGGHTGITMDGATVPGHSWERRLKVGILGRRRDVGTKGSPEPLNAWKKKKKKIIAKMGNSKWVLRWAGPSHGTLLGATSHLSQAGRKRRGK